MLVLTEVSKLLARILKPSCVKFIFLKCLFPSRSPSHHIWRTRKLLVFSTHAPFPTLSLIWKDSGCGWRILQNSPARQHQFKIKSPRNSLQIPYKTEHIYYGTSFCGLHEVLYCISRCINQFWFLPVSHSFSFLSFISPFPLNKMCT